MQPHSAGQATQKKIRVLCVTDHAIVTRSVRAAVERERDMEWAGSLDAADGLAAAVARMRPDVVLVNVDMPGADPFKTLAELHGRRPELRTIVLIATGGEHSLDAAVAAGARGRLSEGDDAGVIIGAIRRVARGEFCFPTEYMERREVVDGRLRPASQEAGGLGDLSAREVRILRMVAQGMSAKDIASEVRRSVKRVESIRTDIMRKLGCEDRLGLTRYAIREGVVEP